MEDKIVRAAVVAILTPIYELELSSVIRLSPTPFSIDWCTTLTGSRSRARASVKLKLSVRSLTPSLPTDLMTTSTRERALGGGRDHRNPRPASIGTGGRLRSELPADFVGMRTPRRPSDFRQIISQIEHRLIHKR